MATNPDAALSANSFLNSIGINVHMAYTDGAYASEPNVASDLAYLGIAKIRDTLPTGANSVPLQNQITALNQLAGQGIKLDLVTNNTNVQADIAAANALQVSSPGAIIALEGPNEINNFPVTYNGLTGQAAATAFQTAYYASIKADTALNGVSVYNFTGATAPVLTPSGTLTQNANGSFTLVKGITGWVATLPVGVTTITATYTGAAPLAGLFCNAPGSGQKGSLTQGANGSLSFTYNNTGTKPMQTYISFSDWSSTTTITSLSAVSGNSGNLVTFDPNMSLAGMADASNSHPYPSGGAAPGTFMNSHTGLPVPGASVITEDGYNTDPNSANGVSQTVQAQDEVKILLDAYNAGVSQTYLYELLDEKPDPSNANAQMHFGLFNSNNTPKLAAVAIHDLTSLLGANNNPVSGFVPGSLAWSATGMPSTASTMLVEKTNGAFDLAVWNEPASANAGAASVSISLGGLYGIVKVFDPITGTAPIATLANVSQVNLSLGADPLIVEVEPAASMNVAAQKLGKVAAFSVAPSAAAPESNTAAVSAPQLAAITPARVGAVAPMSFVEASASAKSASPPVEPAASQAGSHAGVLSNEGAALGFQNVATQAAWHQEPLSVTHTILPASPGAGHFIPKTEEALGLGQTGTISNIHETGFFH